MSPLNSPPNLLDEDVFDQKSPGYFPTSDSWVYTSPSKKLCR